LHVRSHLYIYTYKCTYTFRFRCTHARLSHRGCASQARHGASSETKYTIVRANIQICISNYTCRHTPLALWARYSRTEGEASGQSATSQCLSALPGRLGRGKFVRAGRSRMEE